MVVLFKMSLARFYTRIFTKIDYCILYITPAPTELTELVVPLAEKFLTEVELRVCTDTSHAGRAAPLG